MNSVTLGAGIGHDGDLIEADVYKGNNLNDSEENPSNTSIDEFANSRP